MSWEMIISTCWIVIAKIYYTFFRAGIIRNYSLDIESGFGDISLMRCFWYLIKIVYLQVQLDKVDSMRWLSF